ncbi:unnamed protein product [Phytomonas sp. Hart1]|nr:unnamed protein product [Phytomonas sp. Hart1]|eukprot:CCW66037.1 unnamed protein product [Phytomonas sp. isolate Hart1]
MLVHYTTLGELFAYDLEPAMLRRCLRNTLAAAAASGIYDAAYLLPTAGINPNTTATFTGEGERFALTRENQEKKGDKENGERSRSPVGRTLRLVCRPCSFQAIQDGFLAHGGETPPRPHVRCHVVVCAWALSYLVRKEWGRGVWRAAVDAVIGEFIQLLDTSRSEAAVVIIETLGNGSETPTRHTVLGDHLESKFGFERSWVRTDYIFGNMEEAMHLCRFFFGGDRMKDKFEVVEDDNRPGKVVLKECTGIWTLWKPKTSL